MSSSTVISKRGLAYLVDSGSAHALQSGELDDPEIARITAGNFEFVLHRSDTENFRFVLVGPNCDLATIRERDMPNVLARVRSLAERAQQVDVIIPSNWGPWRHGDLVALWAAPRARKNRRWVTQVRRPSQDVCLWELYGDDDNLDVAEYIPDEQTYFDAAALRATAHARATEAFAARDGGLDTSLDSVVLPAAAIGDVVGSLTYDTWLPRLTAEQKQFVEAPPVHSLKLRGPAGSGKTLSLELKAIREARLLASRDATPRCLFLTHSWAMAGQVDEQLRQLDPVHAPLVEVLPLLAVAQLTVPGDRTAGLPTPGDDALESRQFEIAELAELLATFRSGDWLTYRSGCTAEFISRIEKDEPDAQTGLLWDLIAEFGTVIGANGIFREPGAADRYSAIPRSPWMMPLATRSERGVVYHLYRAHLEALLAQGVISGDHVVNDFLNYLSTFAWSVRRRADGYDLIFVDELHLFTAQERMILRFMSRDDTSYPKIFMSLDPRQSPWERYVPGGDRNGREEGLGEVGDVNLSTVHRFSPQVLALLRHVNHEFPALDLGDDWNLDLDAVTSAAPAGPLPLVVAADPTTTDEVTAVLQRLQVGTNTNGSRQALAIADSQRFGEFEAAVLKYARRAGLSVSVLTSREDSEVLNYSRPRLVVAPAEYLAGLQFDRVVVAGLPRGMIAAEHAGYLHRRFLSSLYLAISRATSAVEIVYSADEGLPPVLDSAIKNRFADRLK